MSRTFLILMIIVWNYSAWANENDKAYCENKDLQESVFELSSSQIIKNVDFHGLELFISGVAPDNNGIVITVRGPDQSYVIRNKIKKYGIWVNDEALRIQNVPSFYHTFASYPQLYNFMKAEDMERFDLYSKIYQTTLHQDTNVRLLESFYSYQQSELLYADRIGEISKIGNNIFKIYVYFPESVRAGDYQIDFYRFADKKLVEHQEKVFIIRHSDFANFVSNSSRDSPLYYGAFSVLIALTAGSIAGYLFRNDR